MADDDHFIGEVYEEGSPWSSFATFKRYMIQEYGLSITNERLRKILIDRDITAPLAQVKTAKKIPRRSYILPCLDALWVSATSLLISIV